MSRTLLETRGTLSAAACMQASPCGTTVTLMGGYWQIKQVVDREGSQDVQVYIARENAAVLARTCDCDSLSCGKWIICQDRLGTDRRSSRNAQNEGGSALSAHATPCGTNWTTLEVRDEHETAQKRLLFELHVSSRLSRACLGKPSLLFSLKIDSLRSIP
jgi:hypothetical protein